jgi:hypothetical protein
MLNEIAYYELRHGLFQKYSAADIQYTDGSVLGHPDTGGLSSI